MLAPVGSCIELSQLTIHSFELLPKANRLIVPLALFLLSREEPLLLLVDVGVQLVPFLNLPVIKKTEEIRIELLPALLGNVVELHENGIVDVVVEI